MSSPASASLAANHNPTATVFALLDAEWSDLAATPIPARWRQHPALDHNPALDDAHTTLGCLLAVTEHRGDPAASDRILAALARLASDAAAVDQPIDQAVDQLAARTLLQALLPGAKALARRLGWLGDAQARAAAVTAVLYERIRTYPIARRPGRIAANLLADTHQQLIRRASAGAYRVTTAAIAATPVSLEGLAARGEAVEAPPIVPTAAEELLALLAWGVGAGHLTAAQAQLIGQSRLADVPAEALGATAGLAAHSLRRRRQRAEQALKHAVLLYGAGGEAA